MAEGLAQLEPQDGLQYGSAVADVDAARGVEVEVGVEGGLDLVCCGGAELDAGDVDGAVAAMR